MIGRQAFTSIEAAMNETATQPRAADDARFRQPLPCVVPGRPRTAEQEAAFAAALESVEHGMTLPPEEEVAVGGPACQRCEVLPRPLRGPGTVYLRFGHTHTLGKVLAALNRAAHPHHEQNGTVSVRVPDGSAAPLLAPLLDLMSGLEQRSVRAFFRHDGDPASPDAFAEEVADLPTVVARARGAWVLDVLRENRLFSVFQPIVSCHTADVHGYECLARAHVDGRTAPPGVMFDLARGAGYLFQLDLAARRAALAGAAEHGIARKVFVNFAPNAIYNPLSCLGSTIRMVDEVGLRREQVVFEVVESEKLPETPHLQKIVRKYRDEGFAVALDDVGSGYSSVEVMLALRPEYVKLDMSLTRDVHADPDRGFAARALIDTAKRLEAKVIAEGVETAEELAWVRANGVDFAQGYLFARPAVPPPAVTRPG